MPTRTDSEQPSIALTAVHKDYNGSAGSYPAIRGVDLRIDPGELVAVSGRSGSGKSTLLNLIAGLDRPSSGQVLVQGIDVGALDETRLAKWRGATVGVVFQFFQLLPTLTVAENVRLPMDLLGATTRQVRARRAVELLDRVGVADQADKLPTTLSGGQQQRVAIARALANGPNLLVADEPTGNLDEDTAATVFELLHELADAGRTVVVVTHDVELAAAAARQIVLADGRIVADTRAADQTAEPAVSRHA